MFISDFLKGIELLLLGCFKVIMQWTYLSWSVHCSGTMPEPWGTCQTSFHLFKANPVDHQHQILDGLQRGSFLKKTIIQCKGELIFDFFLQESSLYILWYKTLSFRKLKNVSFSDVIISSIHHQRSCFICICTHGCILFLKNPYIS